MAFQKCLPAPPPKMSAAADGGAVDAGDGLNAGFCARECVLENDPFRVVVVAEGNTAATPPRH